MIRSTTKSSHFTGNSFCPISVNPNAVNMAGTKPYMAPEMFAAAVTPLSSYSYQVDWWSLGVTVYELLTGKRPFNIHSKTSISANISAIKEKYSDTTFTFQPEEKYLSRWSPEFTKFLQALLVLHKDKRLSCAMQMKKMKAMSTLNFHRIQQKLAQPAFVPDCSGLNCDPTYELEEMIVESKPLHKKKKRLQKQQTLLTQQSIQQAHAIIEAEKRGIKMPVVKEEEDDDPFCDFPLYNREYERYQELLREKEIQWEEELKKLMEKSGRASSRHNSLANAGNALLSAAKNASRKNSFFSNNN